MFVKKVSECQTAWIRGDTELLGVSSRSKLFEQETMVAIGRIRVKTVAVRLWSFIQFTFVQYCIIVISTCIYQCSGSKLHI